jgi:TRAP-type uncharacterized transport system substrate-binding protein
MNKHNLSSRKSFTHHLQEGVHEELHAWSALLREEWPWVLLFLSGFALLLLLTRPFPPSRVYLAAGQPGSSYSMLGQRFAEYFAQHGVKLELVATSGSMESLRALADKNSKVNAGFLLGGSARKGEFPNLVSLGSIQYSPLWLFHREPDIKSEDPLAHFSGKRIAIGAQGSGTHDLLEKIIALRGMSLSKGTGNYVELSHAEAATRLVDGEIDAMCIVDSIDSPIVQKLLATPGVHVFNFGLVPAYAKKLPILDMVTIPRGSLNLQTIDPKEDIRMIASTTTLLVESDTHPAIQLLFLMAADHISDDRNQFFAKPEFFPAYLDHSVPLSPVAKRFYDSGPPALAHLLPLWLASYVDRMWLLAVIAIAYPLYRAVPSYRRFRSELLITGAYEELKALETAIERAEGHETLHALIVELGLLESEIAGTWISADHMSSFYGLKSAVNMVRQRAGARQEQVDGMHPV